MVSIFHVYIFFKILCMKLANLKINKIISISIYCVHIFLIYYTIISFYIIEITFTRSLIYQLMNQILIVTESAINCLLCGLLFAEWQNASPEDLNSGNFCLRVRGLTNGQPAKLTDGWMNGLHHST